MVTPPRCKVCGSPHWGSVHVWPAKKRTTAAPPPPPVAQPRPAATPPAPKAGGPKRDRAAYMRQYRARNHPA